MFIQEIYKQVQGVHYDIPKDDVVYLPQNAEQSFNPLKNIKAHFEDIRLRLKIDKASFYEKVSEYLKFFELPFTCISAYPFECSGGMLQRLQIILAHVQQPKMIIADEPTAALDEKQIQKLCSFWEEACGDGMGFLVVTHQVHHYERFATAILQLKNKQLLPYEHIPLKTSNNVMSKKRNLPCCMLQGVAYRETGGFWRKKRQRVLEIEYFSCMKGEIVGIRGESGSGKTTFLHVLQRRLQFEGALQLPAIQYVPQCYLESLPMNWRVADVIQEAQLFSSKSEEACLNLLQQLQLPAAILSQKVSTLSGGQSQRLALFRVLIKDPQLLLLDEVFANLDDASTQIITDVLRQFVTKGLTMIVVSHDHKWLESNCSKQYVIQQQTLKEFQNEKTNCHIPHIAFNSL